MWIPPAMTPGVSFAIAAFAAIMALLNMIGGFLLFTARDKLNDLEKKYSGLKDELHAKELKLATDYLDKAAMKELLREALRPVTGQLGKVVKWIESQNGVPSLGPDSE